MSASSALNITFPDQSVREYPLATTPLMIAESISHGLAKAAVMAFVDGAPWDLTRPLYTSASLKLITRKDDEALELLRHDCAHVLAMAVQELYPNTQITFGPATEHGLYYDFHRAEPFSSDQFTDIEARMKEIVARDIPIVREEWERKQAAEFFKSKGENFKAEWVDELPESEPITIYRQDWWVDLCRGPHLPSTGRLGTAFKLMKIAGAYWRGDNTRPQLQRIYATCWRDEKELQAYLTQIEEAEKRDHRKLGRQLQLFHLQEEAQGGVFWHPSGWTLYRLLESYMREKLSAHDYREVKTPQLIDRSLWERSGHWEKFHPHMFIAEVDEKNEDGSDSHRHSSLALKPMNCPGHVQIFRQGIKSYRDLPLRMAEFGSCHRYEPSGALHGIMRVRAFTQDDAHIFCMESQILSETKSFIDLLSQIYRDLGFAEYRVKFSDRPAVRAGSDEVWDKAEAALLSATKEAGVEVTLNPGEGAFYGPKLEFVLRDAIGRDWQCGTFQVDFVLPERLDANYIGEDGQKHRPVMLHRAILGSFERFIGILIEQYAGRLPFWLAPRQIAVATITSGANDWAKSVQQRLVRAGLRSELDIRNEKINLKIRELSLQAIPVILVVGQREAEQGQVAMRRLGSEAHQTILTLDEAVNLLQKENQNRGNSDGEPILAN